MTCGQVHHAGYDVKDHCKRCSIIRYMADPREEAREVERIDAFWKSRENHD